MNLHDQRIAVAEALGYKPIHDGRQFHGQQWELHPGCPKSFEELPPLDLNTMHEAIMGLPEDLRCTFNSVLMEQFKDERYGLHKALNATTTQRAEAFLKTIGKWTNSTPSTASL